MFLKQNYLFLNDKYLLHKKTILMKIQIKILWYKFYYYSQFKLCLIYYNFFQNLAVSISGNISWTVNICACWNIHISYINCNELLYIFFISYELLIIEYLFLWELKQIKWRKSDQFGDTGCFQLFYKFDLLRIKFCSGAVKRKIFKSGLLAVFFSF